MLATSHKVSEMYHPYAIQKWKRRMSLDFLVKPSVYIDKIYDSLSNRALIKGGSNIQHTSNLHIYIYIYNKIYDSLSIDPIKRGVPKSNIHLYIG